MQLYTDIAEKSNLQLINTSQYADAIDKFKSTQIFPNFVLAEDKNTYFPFFPFVFRFFLSNV